MSGLSPTGPSQPTLNQAYTTPGNPATKEPAEQTQTAANAATNNTAEVDKRIPSEQSTSQSAATPTPVAQGVRGAPPGEESHGETAESLGRHHELDAAQMGAPGDGRVADAVAEKPGATGAQEGLEVGLERKKEEQAGARERVKEGRREEVDVAGVLGQRGGPASTVD